MIGGAAAKRFRGDEEDPIPGSVSYFLNAALKNYSMAAFDCLAVPLQLFRC